MLAADYNDEKAVEDSREHFYKFLMEQNDQTQCVIMENDPPPIDLGDKSTVKHLAPNMTCRSMGNPKR